MHKSSIIKLPKTNFSMRGDLLNLDKKILSLWNDLNIMNQFFAWSENKPTKLFICGPPYANGFLHTGHKVNFILKDIYIHWWRSQGYNVTHIAGFDCHGRPIEMKINAQINANSNEDIIKTHILQCKQLAENNIQEQYKQLKSLGIFLHTQIKDKSFPYYSTINEYVSIYESFTSLLLNNNIYAQKRPMLWSIDDASVISEIETEYRNITSTSVYIALLIKNTQDKLVIWTTTPWTLIDNAAVAYNQKLKYVRINHKNNNYIICKDLVENFCNKMNIEIPNNLVEVEINNNMFCEHPIIENKFVPILHGDHVDNGMGTGFVHTAPAHGLEDFDLSLKYNIEFTESVNEEGIYYAHTPKLANLHIFKNKAEILEIIKPKCILQEEYQHSYPHALRTNTPVIYRSSNQIFANLNNLNFESVKNVYTTPSHLANGLYEYVKDRKEWCLSRNRTWGVPLAIIIHTQTNKIYINKSFQDKIIAQMHIDPYMFLFKSKFNQFVKDNVPNYQEYSIYLGVLDVWFDSACAYDIISKVLNTNNLPSTFIEGVDQKRGWFQSSLLARLLQNKSIPFNEIISHGFVVDGDGRKLSKSLGNTQIVEDVINKYGNEILRIRMVQSDYTSEISIGSNVMEQCAEIYRKIRNVLRYLISVCETYTIINIPQNIPQIDSIYLYKLNNVINIYKQHMNKSHFHEAFNVLNNFIIEASSDYFNACKYSLYETDNYNHIVYVMNVILMNILQCIKCIIPVTCEEIFQHLKKIQVHNMWTKFLQYDSVHLVDNNDIINVDINNNINVDCIEEYQTLCDSIFRELYVKEIHTGYEKDYICEINNSKIHTDTILRRFGFNKVVINNNISNINIIKV